MNEEAGVRTCATVGLDEGYERMLDEVVSARIGQGVAARTCSRSAVLRDGIAAVWRYEVLGEDLVHARG